MYRHLLVAALVMGLSAGALLWAAPPAEAPGAEQIAKLVEQLGSGSFAEREKAQSALEAIGTPALAALRKATKSDDAELRRRAEELVTAMERRAEQAAILTPTKVQLVYKDTPLGEAIADFAKKTGGELVLHDPDRTLKDRKITLDTGETTFWDALDQFCRKAGVKEASQEDLWRRPIPLPVPPIGPARKVPGVAPAARPAIPPVKKAVPVPPDDGALAAEPEPLPARPAPPPPPLLRPAPLPLPAIGAPMAAWPLNPMPFQAGRITLVDGKADKAPTDASTAFRIRALLQGGVAGVPLPGDIHLLLQITPEPRLRLLSAESVRITKAVDDLGQKLEQAAAEVPAGGGLVAPGGIRPAIRIAIFTSSPGVPLHLKKGDKESKSLEVLSGYITANVLLEAKAFLTVDNILKASGKTVKGDAGGSIKVSDVKEEKEQVTISIALEQPKNVIPENNLFPNGALTPRAMPGAFRPRLAPAPGPAVLPGLPGALIPPGIAAPPALPAPPLPPGAALAMPTSTGPFNGLTLQDAKGNTLPVAVQTKFTGVPGAAMEYQLVFRPEKGLAEPAKLVYTGRKSAVAEIPFTLKGVNLGK